MEWCDSTSAILNKDKPALMKLMKPQVLDICSIFDKTDATPEEIGKAKAKLFCNYI